MPGARLQGLHARFGALLYWVIYLAIPVWLIYAFSELFDKFHAHDIIVWIALIPTAFFTIFGVAVGITKFDK